MLRSEDVVAEQPLERRRVADGAVLELGDEDGGAVARAAAAPRTCGTAAAISRARRDRTASDPALLAGRARGRGGPRRGGRGPPASAPRPASRTSATDRPGGQPHQVEAERRGTDQGVGHGRLQEVGRTMLTVIGPGTPRGRHPFAGERGGDGRVFWLRLC